MDQEEVSRSGFSSNFGEIKIRSYARWMIDQGRENYGKVIVEMTESDGIVLHDSMHPWFCGNVFSQN